MAATFKQCARFSVYYASTYFFLEVIIAPIVAVATGGHLVLATTFAIHFFSVFLVFPSGLMTSAVSAQLLDLDEDFFDLRQAVAAGWLTTALVWGGLFLLKRFGLNLTGDLEPLIGKPAAVVLWGLSTVLLSSTISLGMVWRWTAVRRRKPGVESRRVSGRDAG